jgi:hypothetical protein
MGIHEHQTGEVPSSFVDNATWPDNLDLNTTCLQASPGECKIGQTPNSRRISPVLSSDTSV